MFRNYLLSAWRDGVRNKFFSLISIVGLSIGLTCCFLILLFVRHELSFDNFFQQGNRTYRVTYLPKFAGIPKALSILSPAVSPLMKDFFPEVDESARLYKKGGTTIRQGDRKFEEDKFFFADPAILKIFTFHFLEGTPANALNNSFSVIISSKTAVKFFGNAPALGKQLLMDGQYPLMVTGVVEDYPDNAHIHLDIIANYETMYATISEAARKNLPYNWLISHSLTYVLLKPGLMHQWLMRFAYRTTVSWWLFAVGGLSAIMIAVLTLGYQVVKVSLVNPASTLRRD